MLFAVAYTVQEGTPFYTLLVPQGDDPGHRWLAARNPGDSVDLLGPAGNGFAVNASQRALLLVADQSRAPLLMPLIHPILDHGGRIALLIRTPENARPSAIPLETLLQGLPLAVEARAEPARAFGNALADLAAWSDHICLSLESSDPATYSELLHTLCTTRVRLDPGFVEVLWPGMLPCGVGACLACLVPLAGGGFTRACVHGPVLDLTRLAL
jgi:dihydroorotate dehydrogenase electron transfer subunit